MKTGNDLYRYSKALREQGFCSICGVDEAGRGPLAGPVFAAAVIFPEGFYLKGIDDSKKLTEKKREQIYGELIERVVFSVGTASETEIDEINILQASMIAMRRAIAALPISPDYIIIDGNRLPENLPASAQAVVGGDAKVAQIAAASIIAKVRRDAFMRELAKTYPEYEFEKHKGYPTKLHYERLEAHGPCAAHRRSFLKNLEVGNK